jgi:hypothetical protein
MTDFAKPFDTTRPIGSDFARYGQEEIRKTRSALQERLDLEHYGPGLGSQTIASPTADGRHRPGNVSVVLLDTEANILATTPGGKGSLAFSTDTKKLLIWNGTNWSTNFIGGGMKQIIRGVNNVSFSTPTDITIAEVVTAKCLVFVNGFNSEFIRFSFPTTTTLRLTNTNSSGNPSIEWQLIEYF